MACAILHLSWNMEEECKEIVRLSDCEMVFHPLFIAWVNHTEEKGTREVRLPRERGSSARDASEARGWG